LHQLNPHPPVANSSVVVGLTCVASVLASVDPAGTKEGIYTEFDKDQSFKFGSKEECIRKCESVDIDAYISVDWFVWVESAYHT